MGRVPLLLLTSISLQFGYAAAMIFDATSGQLAEDRGFSAVFLVCLCGGITATSLLAAFYWFDHRAVKKAAAVAASKAQRIREVVAAAVRPADDTVER